MLRAVDLDHEPRGVTAEIDDIAIDWNLPFEFGAVETRAAQALPQNVFR
jgi:hypothetical protein